MDTKQKGDIAEQAVVLKALKQGWGVLKPVGDRLPYDLVLDIGGSFVKVQVKYAWFDIKRNNYVVDTKNKNQPSPNASGELLEKGFRFRCNFY
jgi:hypothetical protein